MIDVWQKKSLLYHFSLMNLKLRYKGSYLGFLWVALEPILTFLVLYLVFTGIRNTREEFGVYLLGGILIYHIFSRGTMAGMNSIRNNKGIIQSLNFKTEFFIVASVGSIALTTLVEMGVFLSFLPFLNFVPSFTLFLLPVVLLLLLFLILGFSYLLSTISVYVKDIQWIWGVIIHALFFISPIFWYVDDVDGVLLEIHKINPVGQIIELGHKIIFGELPSFSDWMYSIILVMGILIVSFFIYKRQEAKISEVL